MADHVYRRFTNDDLFHTTINAQPQTVVESGTSGWTGNTLLGNNSLSLYGDVRSRADVFSGTDAQLSASGLFIYPIDEVDTHSIDKVIGVPGKYPATGSINLVALTNSIAPNAAAVTDLKWYDEHYAPLNLLSDWNNRRSKFYHPLDTLPSRLTVIHVPEMFYGRQIATGSILIWTHAWDLNYGSNVLNVPPNTNPWATENVSSLPFGFGLFGAGVYGNAAALSGTRYYVDDGRGRLLDVPSASIGDWKSAWMSGTAYRVGTVFYNEGLIVFTHPDPTWHNQFISASYSSVGSAPTLHVEFRGNTVMKSYVFMCRMPQAAVNASNNPTYYSSSIGPNGEPQRWSKFPSSGTVGENRTYITAVGIYNEERQLVAVAKIAQPIRKRETDNIDIRLRLDI